MPIFVGDSFPFLKTVFAHPLLHMNGKGMALYCATLCVPQPVDMSLFHVISLKHHMFFHQNIDFEILLLVKCESLRGTSHFMISLSDIFHLLSSLPNNGYSLASVILFVLLTYVSLILLYMAYITF